MNSSYPKWWSDTITLYNKHESNQTGVVQWYRTVLTDCFWQNQFQKFNVGNIEVNSDVVICRIPENELYLNKFEWKAMPNDEKSEYFTLAQGDIIVLGEVEDEIDEYTGLNSNDFVTKYKDLGCIVIDRVSDNTGVGRGLRHYHVEGI